MQRTKKLRNLELPGQQQVLLKLSDALRTSKTVAEKPIVRAAQRPRMMQRRTSLQLYEKQVSWLETASPGLLAALLASSCSSMRSL